MKAALVLVLTFSAFYSHARKRVPWDGLPINADQRIFEALAEVLEIQKTVGAPQTIRIKDLECTENPRPVVCSGTASIANKEQRKNINDADFFLKYLIIKKISELQKNDKGLKVYRVSALECRYQLEVQPYYECGDSAKLFKGSSVL